MKITNVTVSCRKTIQEKQFEPVAIEVTMTASVDSVQDLESASSALGNMVQIEVERILEERAARIEEEYANITRNRNPNRHRQG